MNIAVVFSSDAQRGIIEGLKNLGHNVAWFYYGLEREPLYCLYLMKIFKIKEKQIIRRFNTQLVSVFSYHQKYPFDLILIIKGQDIGKRSHEILLRNDIHKIQWTIDPVQNWPGQATLFPFMEKVFFHSESDLNLHHNSEWLPLGFDHFIFNYEPYKKIDILFIGNVRQPTYSKRRECFMRLAFLAQKGYEVCFAGSTPDKDLLRVFKFNGVKILGRQPLNKYASLIKRSRICINIHQDAAKRGAINPMFFAIPATGGLELTDNFDFLNEWLIPFQDYYPTTPETITEDILPLLSSPPLPENIANDITKKHSYFARARMILSD